MTIEVTSISAINAGAEVVIEIKISEGENFEKRKVILLARQYAELRVHKGEIDRDYLDTLISEGEVCAAVKRGMNILGYGACSEKNMAFKLRAKGFDKESALRASKYLSELGYINECDDAEREAERCIKKLWGIKRIVAFLYEKGYTDTAVRLVVSKLEEYDFTGSCVALIERKFRALPEDREEQKKLFAALVRCGHTPSDIKKAFAIMAQK